ncbi:MAG: DUF6716 putative glycosyltransferase [Hansschlegelia sp.]
MIPQADADAPASEGRFAGRRVLAIGTFDSFVKTAAIVGRLFEAEGASLQMVALAAANRQLSKRQLRNGGLDERLPVVTADALVGSRLFRDAEIVVAVVDGGRARELFLTLAAADLSAEPRRPLIAIASPGLVLDDHLAGFMDRAPADVLCFNTEGDRALYQAAAAEIGVDATNAVVSGLLGLDRRPWSPPQGRPTITFFEQPVMPARRLQRVHLLVGLVDLAKRFPEADVLVKLRHARGEVAHHAARFHLEDIARELSPAGGLPTNLGFTHEPAATLLDRTSLAVTVSSTVAVEAMARGVPTRILSDFGVSEALGSAYFVGSGCFSPLAALRPDMGVAVDPGWLAGSGALAAPEPLLAQCAALLAGQAGLDAPLPLRPLTPAYGSRDWLRFALGEGGPAAVHAPHLLERPKKGLALVRAVARRLARGRVARPKR